MVCSEIEAVVIETSRFFHHVNFKAEQDKRAIMEPSDGRNYLLGTSQKFDAIISEPSNPWQSGVCNLFTQEYFKICRDNLAKGGVFTFWTQIGEIPPKNLGEVFSALHSVFPCVYVMSTGIGDVNCIAFPEQRKIKYDDLKKSFAIEKVRSALARFNLTTPEDFIARIMVAPDGVEKATKGVPPNSDDINKLEYEVSKTYENRQFRYQILGWMNDNCGNISDSIDWGTMTDEQKSKSFYEIARACAGRDGNYAMRWCHESIKLHPNADAMDLIAEVLLAQKKYADALKVLNEGQKLYPKEERFFGLAGLLALKQADYAKAIPLFEQALQINKSNYDFHYYLAQCFSGLDLEELDVPYAPPAKLDPARVVELCSFASQNPKFVASRPNVLLLLAEGYKDVGKYAEASNIIKGILRDSPTKFGAWKTLAEIYAGEKQWDRSAFCWNQYFDLTSKNLNSFIARTRQIMDQGNDVEALRRLQYLNKLAPANAELQGMLKELSGRNQAAKKFYDSVNIEPEIFEAPQAQPKAKSSAGL
jgi:tetratricopeptide (TPR) repeat protein